MPFKEKYVKPELSDAQKMEMFKFLMCLNVVKRDKVYLGTVSFKEKMKRRSLNARQKSSRRANR
jgi:hypothetical protein